MPRFRHPVPRAFRGDRQAIKLARQADGEVADIDHLLHFAESFLQDLACFERDEATERRLFFTQAIAKEPHEFAASRRRHIAPLRVSRAGLRERRIDFSFSVRLHAADAFAGDRRGHVEVAAVGELRDAEFGENRIGVHSALLVFPIRNLSGLGNYTRQCRTSAFKYAC